MFRRLLSARQMDGVPIFGSIRWRREYVRSGLFCGPVVRPVSAALLFYRDGALFEP